jgi:hypothetical protein
MHFENEMSKHQRGNAVANLANFLGFTVSVVHRVFKQLSASSAKLQASS